MNNNIEIETKRTNGFAIAGFVIAFFHSVLGLIFSIIGLHDTKKYNEKGKGLAIAGIIVSILRIIFAVILCFLLAATFASMPEKDPTINPVKSEIVNKVEEKVIENLEEKYGKETVNEYLENIDEDKLMEEIDNGNIKLSDLAKMVTTADTNIEK